MNKRKANDMSGYNGWTNYETWNVKLWLDNDEGSSSYWAERADDCVHGCEDNKDGIASATGDLARELEEQIKEQAPDLGASCYADLLGAALSEVNWYEIAESFVGEALERIEA